MKNEDKLKEFVEQTEQSNALKNKVQSESNPLHKGTTFNSSLDDVLGYQEIPLKDLPTKGLFYPDEARILIRAATAGEIRHWSTMNDDNMSDVYDHLNYIIEKCVYFKLPDGTGNWKMIKEMDRLYLLLAIRDFTFLKDDNELKLKISESNSVAIHKDNIDFITIPEEIMKHYNASEKCFIFKFKTGNEIKMYIPSIGVSSWLKKYLITKEETKEGYDKDFIQLAPMLIPDDYKLSNRSYEEFILNIYPKLGIYEYSLISKVYDMLIENSVPKIKYKDEAGADQTAPLTFSEGFKSIFTVSDVFDGLL